MIKFNILTKQSAEMTIKAIAELDTMGIDAVLDDMLPTVADAATACGKWQLNKTAFACIEIADRNNTEPTVWLYKKDWSELIGKDINLLVVENEEIALFDEDTPSKQWKFKDYTDDDTKSVLLGWAKSVSRGSEIDDIPIYLDAEIPSGRRKKLPSSYHDSIS